MAKMLVPLYKLLSARSLNNIPYIATMTLTPTLLSSRIRQLSSWGAYNQLLKSVCLICTSYGNQGSAQAQNLRDSGIPNDKIIIANRDDNYASTAKNDGFTVTGDFSKAAEVADGWYKAIKVGISLI
jgi:hypothetical protein